jgi:hypothetical protein
MEDYLVAMGVASLEILEPQIHLSVGRQRPEPCRLDTMIGLKDLECMSAFHYSGWEVPTAVENKRQEQLAKWHIRMILRNGHKTCLNVCKTLSKHGDRRWKITSLPWAWRV